MHAANADREKILTETSLNKRNPHRSAEGKA